MASIPVEKDFVKLCHKMEAIIKEAPDKHTEPQIQLGRIGAIARLLTFAGIANDRALISQVITQECEGFLEHAQKPRKDWRKLRIVCPRSPPFRFTSRALSVHSSELYMADIPDLHNAVHARHRTDRPISSVSSIAIVCYGAR